MFRNRLYYELKPYLPYRVRMALRRAFARRTRLEHTDVWPIHQAAGQLPDGWPGWPDGKKFALVLTHDVEGPEGLAKCRDLMKLEMKLGFRSSFNFVPEGDYTVPPELRAELTQNGFEVGVHDLHHDGKLYSNRRDFLEKTVWINRYLKEWGAVGFRAGFMFRNLDWHHDLDILYDSCTFDTDPFEPQPDGTVTIFPFWVPRPITNHQSPVTSHFALRPGYVELPYTLPQDSTLFLLLGETSPEIWLRKLDWIAERGGMALVNVHPDYLQFNGADPSPRTFPATFYTQVLEYAHERYGNQFWNALPRDVARMIAPPGVQAPTKGSASSRINNQQKKSKSLIWIDLDNTPHVPFFEPIIDELRAQGYPLLVTARDAFQVCALADKRGVDCIKIGRHYGKNRLFKGLGLLYRALQLSPIIVRAKPVLAVSHGARSQLVLAKLLGIPSVLIGDYEHALFPWLMHPTWLMVPEVISQRDLCLPPSRVRRYPGIKEDVYAWKLKPDSSVLEQLGIEDDEILVTARPPATEAHYHNPQGEEFFDAFMQRVVPLPGVRVVLLPRNRKQEMQIRRCSPSWFQNGRTIVPRVALDGMNLIWHSDLVVSGGGTMNREAAALGVPVYTVFRGAIGAVDRQLSQEGRLVLIESLDEVHDKILLVKRPRENRPAITPNETLPHIVAVLEQLASANGSSRG